VFLRYREKSVWLTDFLNLQRDEKSTFLGREFDINYSFNQNISA